MANPGLQISLNVKGRTCLILGGEEEATEKTHRLLEAGAKVIVVHPSLNDELRKLTASAKILHRGRRFRQSDTEGALLIINTIRDDEELSTSLYELSKAHHFLVCSSDQPSLSNVMMPALVTQSHLRLAISSSGVAPALASRLRQDFETAFDEEFGKFINWLAETRESVQANEESMEQRIALLRQAVEGFKLSCQITYPSSWAKENSHS